MDRMPKKKTWINSAHRGFVDSLLKENTLGAFQNAWLHGAQMIEADARLSRDGVLICNHDPVATGLDPKTGRIVTYVVADTDSEILRDLILSWDDTWGEQRLPTLDQALELARRTGMQINIDIKNGTEAVDAVLRAVTERDMLGRVVYAMNGAPAAAMKRILDRDPDARFIDRLRNFTPEKLKEIEDYPRRCYVYTGDFSPENIAAIRASGCMLAVISLHMDNYENAIRYEPDMCEFLHTSDFRQIENSYFQNNGYF